MEESDREASLVSRGTDIDDEPCFWFFLPIKENGQPLVDLGYLPSPGEYRYSRPSLLRKIQDVISHYLSTSDSVGQDDWELPASRS